MPTPLSASRVRMQFDMQVQWQRLELWSLLYTRWCTRKAWYCSGTSSVLFSS